MCAIAENKPMSDGELIRARATGVKKNVLRIDYDSDKNMIFLLPYIDADPEVNKLNRQDVTSFVLLAASRYAMNNMEDDGSGLGKSLDFSIEFADFSPTESYWMVVGKDACE
jgi:hypothetical protein